MCFTLIYACSALKYCNKQSKLMNETSTIYFNEIENLQFEFLIIVVNENMPDPEILELTGNKDNLDIYNKINQYVVVEKHFLDKDISMNIIWLHCNVGKASLNKILRQRDEISFHGYINKQRVIYAASLLLDPSNKLIEVVALEASFNNSRTFVRNFKKFYHMTPSEYRRLNGFKSI